jgi:hypothetical protein
MGYSLGGNLDTVRSQNANEASAMDASSTQVIRSRKLNWKRRSAHATDCSQRCKAMRLPERLSGLRDSWREPCPDAGR